MNDDAVLLRRYSVEGSEAAFTELVRRHVDLVYGTALRRTNGNTQQAADIAQQVFIKLARHARKLSRHPVLSAWLHTATRNEALNVMISEQRRKARESEAVTLESVDMGGTAPAWDQVRLLLDTTIDHLPDKDRVAVVLRYLERRGFAEIGAALKVSEDAARMRTERALDKLRLRLAKRGITSTAAALSAMVSSQPLISAPAGLAANLASQALVIAGSGSLAAFLVSFMSTKLITTAVLSALVAFVAGTFVGGSRQIESSTPPTNQTPRQTPSITSLGQDNDRLKTVVASLNTHLAQLNEVNKQLTAQHASLPPTAPVSKDLTLGLARWEIQQATLKNLQQISSAREQFQIEKGRPATSVDELVGRGRYLKTLRTVNGEDYSGLSMIPGPPLTVTASNGISVTFDPTGAATTQPEFPPEVVRVQELGQRIQEPVNQTINAYRAGHKGGNPPTEEALIPYFANPKDGADYVEFMETKKATGF